jgi:hypothetical protein
MTISRQAVLRRLQVFGLNKSQALQIIHQVNEWINHNGFEWTINRIKSMKIYYIQSLANPKEKHDLSWIKSRNGIPTGPFRSIFRLNTPKKILNSLMIYSQFVSPAVTAKQYNKFSKSVHQENDDSRFELPHLSMPKCMDIYIKHESTGSMKLDKSNVDKSESVTVRFPITLEKYEFGTHLVYPRSRSPIWRSLTGNTAVNTAMNSVLTFGHLYVREYLNKYYKDYSFPDWYSKSIGIYHSQISEVHVALDHNDHVGRISFIQEPGYKLRAVANPYPSFQILLEPLKDFVMKSLEFIPEDYCHNQDEALNSIKQYLGDDLDFKLSSIDLSDASNNIPLKPQIELIARFLGADHPQLELFTKVSRGKWYVRTPDGDSSIQYNVGQPMGLGPSFGLFSIFHHFVMRLAINIVDGNNEATDDFFELLTMGHKRHNSKKREDYLDNRNYFPYWIVGDDIVMDSSYQDAYISIMNGTYNVPISIDKCIFNSRYAEMCSRIINKDHVTPSYKWKEINDSSFLDVAKNLGIKSYNLFKPKQKVILDHIAQIPDTLGGPVSWNPQSLCLQEREAKFWTDAEKYLSVSSETSPYVRRETIQYEFLRDIGVLLHFDRVSVHDTIDKVSPKSIETPMDDLVDGRLSLQRQIILTNYYDILNEESDGIGLFKKDPIKYYKSEQKWLMSAFQRAVHKAHTEVHAMRLTDLEYHKLQLQWAPDRIAHNEPIQDRFFMKMYNLYSKQNSSN